MRKGDNGGKKGGGWLGNGRRMMKIVATNVVASRPPELRPTATPTLVPKERRKEEGNSYPENM